MLPIFMDVASGVWAFVLRKGGGGGCDEDGPALDHGLFSRFVFALPAGIPGGPEASGGRVRFWAEHGGHEDGRLGAKQRSCETAPIRLRML